MSKSPLQMVAEFHDAFGTTRGYSFAASELRYSLIDEEANEVADAMLALWDVTTSVPPASDQLELFPTPTTGVFVDAKQALAKELADLVYVVYGTADVFGIDLDRVLEEVHKSNMSKLGADGKPVLREDGKVLKGPTYREPDLSFVK